MNDFCLVPPIVDFDQRVVVTVVRSAAQSGNDTDVQHLDGPKQAFAEGACMSASANSKWAAKQMKNCRIQTKLEGL
jgi:hypothetical protein